MLTPRQHYAEADRLLSSIDPTLIDKPLFRARIAAAHVHAVLATCQPPLEVDAYNVSQADEAAPVVDGRLYQTNEVTWHATGDRL